MSERSRIAQLQAIFAGVTGEGVRTAIGDDAAVLSPPRGDLVVTVDDQVEGTHFRRSWLELADVGYRATMAAASDVAAMGATPWVIVAAVVLPESLSERDLADLAAGQQEAARALGAPIVGGNLARGPTLSVSTTVLGVLAPGEHAVTRAGAIAGDGVWLAGAIGLAGAASGALLAGIAPEPSALAAWRRPRALVAEGRRMQRLAHAAVDVSDGLARDASHVAEASGVRIVFDGGVLDALVSPELARAAAALGVPARDLLLGGGEDYALLCASPVAIEGFVRVGECGGSRPGTGVFVRDGALETPVDRGFDHFA